MNYKLNNDVPCGYITKEKQRVKQFGENVYLKDGSEFEIELYNPSRKTVLSKIKINGEFIKGGGIILRPGERVFLERYLDTTNKFKFETYSVDNSTETKNAIASNGDVEILFYDEEDPIDLRINTYTVYPTYINTNLSTPIGNNFYSSNLNYTSQSNMDVSLTSTIETGRVEKGSKSNQTFKTVNKNFNIWTVSTSVWKILPESQKPIEKRDLVERCPKCSTKIKKSNWKFCPECGNEIKKETIEQQLNKLSKEELIELLKNK